MVGKKWYKCKYCGEKYEMAKAVYAERSMGALRRCCEKKDCMARAGAKWIRDEKERKRKEERKRWEKKKKMWQKEVGVKKKNHKDLLQIEVNRIAMLIDRGKRCIARPDRMGENAGHVYSVGSWPSLRYHMDNIHRQSIFSNEDRGGEPLLMLEGIERDYGVEYREELEGLRKKYPVLQLSEWEKNEKVAIARKIIREWAKNPMGRDQVNELLEIYK